MNSYYKIYLYLGLHRLEGIYEIGKERVTGRKREQSRLSKERLARHIVHARTDFRNSNIRLISNSNRLHPPRLHNMSYPSNYVHFRKWVYFKEN